MNPDPRRPMLNDDQLRELARRVAEDDASPDDVIAWEEVKAEILRRSAATEGVSDAAFDELAAELFRGYDTEEEARQ